MANVLVRSRKHQQIETREAPARLQPWCEYYWQVTWRVPAGQEQLQQILTEPKADLYLRKGQDRWKLEPIRKILFEINLQGEGAVFGIRLKPANQSLFLGRIDLPLLDWDAPFAERADAVDLALTNWEWEDSPERDQVNEMIERIAADRELRQVKQLLDRFGMDARKAQRLFKKHLGLGPKWIIGRYRLLEAVRQAQDKDVDWAGLAADLGYSDQAHYIRDFKSACHLTPEEYRQAYLQGALS